MLTTKLLTTIGMLFAALSQGKAECGDHVTVEELEQLFIGRCMDYQTTLHKPSFCPIGSKDCSDLWKKFVSAFNNTSSQCNVSVSSYDDFIKAADLNITGKQLFWSGVRGFAQRFSEDGLRYTTLEDTLIGYLINGLNFCGGTAGGNPNVPCPRRNATTCPSPASAGFWTSASINFAKKAAGEVYVLLNATNNPIIKNTSTFWTFELPQWRKGVVTKLTAYLINESPESVEACKEDKSIKDLKDFLMNLSISFDCIENPRELLFTYCADPSETSAICSGFIVSSASVPALTLPLSIALIMTIFKYLL